MFIYGIFFYGVKLFSLTPFFFYTGPTGISHKDRKSKSKISFRIFRSNLLYYIHDFFKSIVERNIKERSSLYMINTTSTSGHTAYGLKDFVIDKKSDLQNLPINPCSTAS